MPRSLGLASALPRSMIRRCAVRTVESSGIGKPVLRCPPDVRPVPLIESVADSLRAERKPLSRFVVRSRLGLAECRTRLELVRLRRFDGALCIRQGILAQCLRQVSTFRGSSCGPRRGRVAEAAACSASSARSADATERRSASSAALAAVSPNRLPRPKTAAPALGAYHVQVPPPDHQLYRFLIDRALDATYRFRGDWPPIYRRWRAA